MSPEIRRASRPLLLAAAWAVASATLAPGAARAQEITFAGQVRPRFEARDPATVDGGGQAFTSMRTRLSAAASLGGDVSAFVQLQDVRLFGEESGTLGDFSADGLDLHQGWVQVGADGGLLSLRVGRQEAAYGGQRLIGPVGWTQQGRSFDGVRARVGESGATARVDAFAFQLSESASPTRTADAAFLGTYATVDAGPSRALELYALWNRAEAGDADTEEVTAGGRYVASAGSVEYRLEGAWQGGERAGRDVGAWFFGARAGAAFAGGDARVTLWYDHLSGDGPGDDEDDENGAFSTLFATNHKFYGYADLFLDIPAHTAGRGLRDAALKLAWTPAPCWSAGLDLHRFVVAEDAGLESGHLGDEVDLTVGYLLTQGARLSGGVSYVGEGDALAPVRGIDESVLFGYLMLDVVF